MCGAAARAWAVVALGALVAACGGAPQAESVGTGALALDLDEGTQLATLLPSRSEECTVARPTLLADRRRPLVQRASLGDVLAWSREPRIVAYASAGRRSDEGRDERVTLLRLTESYAGRQAELGAALPVRVRWSGARCRADECDLPVASMIDGRTLRIERGRWDPEDVGGSPCVALAVAWPSAIQVDAELEECGERAQDSCVQRRILQPTSDGLAQRAETALGSEEAAVEALEALRHVPDVEGGIEIDRRGATVVQQRRFSWEQLELALEDERIERAAYARRHEAQRARPVEAIDVEQLAHVRQQVRLHEERLARLSGEGRRRAAEQLASLLTRAYERHPAELDLAERSARLQLDVLDDPDAAAQMVETVIARAGAPLESWRAMRREVRVARLAASPEDEARIDDAARALVDDGIARDAAAGRAAANDLAALRASGIAYDLAESAWSQARATSARSVAMSSLPRGVGAPITALPATLVWLAEAGGDPGPISVFVVARGTLREHVARASSAGGPEDAVLVRFDSASSAPLVAGSAASTDALLRLGALLDAALAPGALTIDVAMVSLSAPGVARTLRVEGELGVGRMSIARADSWTARHDWARVERYLAEPLATLGTRVFPPPELSVRATSEEEAARLAAIGDDPPQSRCEANGAEIRCAPRADSDARGSLRRIARAALGAPAGLSDR